MTATRDLVILIPHQRPPEIADPARCDPPVEADGDQYIAGDHDCHAACTVGEWIDHPHIRDHQRHAVQALVDGLLTEAE